ncbi:hypothetical protein Csa_011978 [Cucumis sativus]|nr:hypothetical protein Csa_011978 [Cucumis sativus]
MPSTQTIGLQETNNEEESVDNTYRDEPEFLEPDEGDQLSCVLRHVLITPKTENLCQVVIDSGSVDNIASKKLITALKLIADPHPNAFKANWITKKGETTIKEICTIPLSIGNLYEDQLVCDVLEMDVCLLLLGLPWKYYNNVTHNGRENTYEPTALPPLRNIQHQIDLTKPSPL